MVIIMVIQFYSLSKDVSEEEIRNVGKAKNYKK